MTTDTGLLDLRHCMSNNLQKTARAVSRVFAEEMRPAGLTRAQFPILGVLNASGPLSMGDIAHRLYMERTTLTRHLKPLEEAGFVSRPTGEADARVRLVAITAAGRRKLHQAERYWRNAQNKMLERYGNDAWQQLEDALRTLRRLAV
jgi:DNA-binding MarR family transcriptional regulator